MKIKFKMEYILLIFFISSIMKYIFSIKEVPNIASLLLGLIYIFVYYFLYLDLLKYVDISKKNKNYILSIVVFANIITAMVNSSSYMNDLINTSAFMYLYIFSKILYYFSTLICFLNTKNKKTLLLFLILQILAYLSFLEVLQKIEVYLEIFMIIMYYILLLKNREK